eukprot:6203544-Pleurochrysis_carterae.AAC.1
MRAVGARPCFYAARAHRTKASNHGQATAVYICVRVRTIWLHAYCLNVMHLTDLSLDEEWGGALAVAQQLSISHAKAHISRLPMQHNQHGHADCHGVLVQGASDTPTQPPRACACARSSSYYIYTVIDRALSRAAWDPATNKKSGESDVTKRDSGQSSSFSSEAARFTLGFELGAFLAMLHREPRALLVLLHKGEEHVDWPRAALPQQKLAYILLHEKICKTTRVQWQATRKGSAYYINTQASVHLSSFCFDRNRSHNGTS